MKIGALHVSQMAAGCWVLLGCAHRGPVPAMEPPEARLVQIEVIKSRPDGSNPAPLALPLDDPNAGLRAAEDFALTIEQNAPGHLYVVRSGASGVTRLYPGMDAKDAPQPAGRLRVPGDAGWLRVASLDSTDLLCVVTSQNALAPADLSCQTSTDGERGEDSPPPPPDRQKPQTHRPPPPPPRDIRSPDFLRVLPLPIQRTL